MDYNSGLTEFANFATKWFPQGVVFHQLFFVAQRKLKTILCSGQNDKILNSLIDSEFKFCTEN